MLQTSSIDEVLATTRSVRKRLDFSRPVERKLIEQSLAIAQQAPNGGNLQLWKFIVVTDPTTRTALADLYRRGFETFKSTPIAEAMGYGNPNPTGGAARVMSSINYLVDHIGEAPVLVIPCIGPRAESLPTELQHAMYGSIAPAAWSFMLAARARGLGSCWTVFHLYHEREAAELLGLNYDETMQISMIPVAHVLGERFGQGPRRGVEEMVQWVE